MNDLAEINSVEIVFPLLDGVRDFAFVSRRNLVNRIVNVAAQSVDRVDRPAFMARQKTRAEVETLGVGARRLSAIKVCPFDLFSADEGA